MPWTATDLIGQAWGRFRGVWAPLVGGLVVTSLIGQIPPSVPRVLVAAGILENGDRALVAINLGVALVGFVLSAFFQGGLLTMNLKAARGESPRFADAFSGGRYFVPLLGVTLLTVVIVGLGCLALIIPGFVLLYGLMLAPYYVVDQGLGPIDALRASWRATKGQKGSLFVLALLGGLMFFGGLIACGVGMLVAIPVYALAVALAYLHIAGRIEPAPWVVASGGHGPPGGGFGPPADQGPPPAGGFGTR